MIGYQIKSIGTPLVALLSDVSAMSLLVTAYAVYKYGDDAINYFKNEAYEDLQDLYKDFMTVTKGLPVIRQGIAIADLLQQFGLTPSEAGVYDDRYWNQPGYNPSMQGDRTR